MKNLDLEISNLRGNKMSEQKIMSIVSIPLKTEIWQNDVIFKRFEMCRKIYNVMLGYELKQYKKMKNTKEYSDSLKTIYDIYKLPEKDKKIAKRSDEYKKATETQNQLMRDYGFSEFQFRAEAIKRASYFKENIPSVSASDSIGATMWSAFEKMFFDNGRIVHYKKYDSWKSISSNGKSGLRIVNETNKTLLHGISDKMYLLFGVRPYKVLRIPLKVDKKDLYKLEMLDRDFKVVRLTRKKVRGTYKYYVQLTVVGAPAVRYSKTGEQVHKIGTDKIGVYIDTRTITISNKDKVFTKDISFGNDDIEAKVTALQQYMEHSRRATNPDNFNADGTIKKGLWKDGQRVRLTWKFSNGYKKAKDELANILRVKAEQRKLRNTILANEVLSYGSEIIVNDYPFQAAAMRKKKDELTEKGTPASKAKAGKVIGENAPADIVLMIDTKLKGAGYQGVQKEKLSSIDYQKDKYREFYANEMRRK